METVRGIIEYINGPEKTGFYSVKMAGNYYGAGKYAPKFNEGDEVEFGYTENGKYKNMDFKTVKVIEKGSGEVKKSQSGNTTQRPQTNSTNWDEKDKRITFLACRKDAIEIMKMALDRDALTLPTKKADRMETLVELVDTLANDLYGGVYDSEFKLGE